MTPSRERHGSAETQEPLPVGSVPQRPLPPAGAARDAPGDLPRGQDLMLILQDFTTESGRYAEGARRGYGLAHSDVQALTEVMQAGRRGDLLRAGDIARRLVISPSSATAVINRLVNRGHLTRESDPRDRREVVLGITPSASVTGRAMFTPMVEELLKEFETWSDAELDVVRRRIPELTEAIKRAQGRPSPGVGGPGPDPSPVGTTDSAGPH